MPPVSAPRARNRVLLETLEPRILYSADLAAVAGAVGAGGVDTALTQGQELRLQTSATTATATVATAAEIAFVDLGVPDAGSLVSGLLAQRAQGRLIEVVTFASNEDGLARLSQTLAERQAEGARFDAVHVFSHGSAGALQLGSARLDADSLLRRAGEIAGWGGALSAQADLLLYGCDVADGADGLFLIEGLAALTGADVAASDDTTGSAALGGDWLLEQFTGAIESTVAVDALVQRDWAGTLGNEIPVNSTTAGNQNTAAETRGSQQAVTLDANGNYTVVWTGPEGSGGGKGIFVRRFAYDGTALTGEIQVNTTTSKNQENARIVGDSAGNFAVVWTSQDQDGTTASVYFRRFAANGTALSGEIRANASDTGDQLNAVIGMNGSNGDVVVAWQGDGPGGQSVFFRRFAQDGTALDATDRAAGTLDSELNPAVAMDATGRFVVVWNEGTHLFFQRYDASGATAGGITQVDNNLSNSVGPTVAMNDQGKFVIAYREQDTIPGIWGRTFNADGSPRAFWFNADTGGATSPSISMAADGSAVVVYQKTGDGDGMGIYGRKISAAGAVQGTPFLVNQSTAKEQVAASVAVRSVDQFVVAWSGDSAADMDGVYARTFEPANAAPLITTNGGTSTAAVSVAENTTAVTTVGASDADWPVQTVRYTIVGGADQARFSLDSVSGALRFVVAPDFEAPGDADGNNVYEVTVQASDLLLATTQALSVTVTDVADQVVAVADTATTPYASAVTLDVLANDRIGTGSALSLLDVSQPAHGKATVVGGQVVYTPYAGFVGTETLHYRIIDGSEGLALYAALDDNIGSLAGEPSPTAGQFGQALRFDGVDDRLGLAGVTYTPEFTLSYWFKLASNSGTGYHYLYSHGGASVQNSLNTYFIQDATVTASGVKNVLRTALFDGNDATATANLAALDIPVTSQLTDNQWHQYTLTTQAGGGSAVYIDGQLRASSATQGGDAIAPTGTVYLGARTDLASARFLTGALDDVALYHRTIPAAAVATLYSNASPGTTGTVTITVTPVNTETPVITSDGGGPVGTPTVAENTTAVTTVTATDADVGGPALTYSIVGGADQALFSIDSASGVVRFRSAPDAERPDDVGRDNVYYVDVQASDGLHIATQTLKIAVTDANEHAVSPIADADATRDEVDENAAVGTPVGLTARATDADSSLNTVTYTLTDTAGGRFAIDANSGVVTVAGLLDAEAATAHRITVRAASSDGSVQMLDFVLTVRDLDEFDVGPPADADAAADRVLESAAAGTTVGITAAASDADLSNSSITYSLTDDAGGRFAIGASSGVVTVARLLDAETALSHSVTVQARSTDGSVASQSFTIAVQDVDESPVGAIVDLDAAADEIREDAATGTAVGFQAQATDADVSNNTVTYTLLDDAGGRFAIGAGSGVVMVARSLDAETAVSHAIQIRATSSDGSTSTRLVTLTVLDVDEFDVSTPVDADTAANTVQNIDAVGTAVGLTASASDADAGLNQITYTLSDDAGGRFAIDADTGVVTLARSIAGDAGTTQSLVVQATSADGSVATSSFSVAVTRANLFAPVIGSDGGGSTAILTVQENTSTVTTVVATDADVAAGPPVYTLVGGADQALFTLDAATGVLRFLASPDAETPRDADRDNAYAVVVQASDGLRTDTQTLRITVADVNEFALGPLADTDGAADGVQENAAIGSTVGVQLFALDADATNSRTTYRLDDSAGGRFAIDASTGLLTVAGLLDAETALAHTVVVRAVSDDGSASTLRVTIAVQDMNEHGVSAITDGNAGAEVVREDDPVGTLVGVTAQAQDLDATDHAVSYSLLDDAGGRFSIHATTGVVTIARTLDAETAQSHTFVVRALSSDGSAQTQSYTVAVRDVDEFDLTAIADTDAAPDVLAEDVAIGTRVGLTARAVDADVTNNTVTYSLLDSAGGRFSIDASTGVVTVAATLDAETAQRHTLVVRATSSDRSLWTQAFAVAVSDVDEFDLVAIGDTDAVPDAVAENAAIGASTGLRARAVDADVTNNTVTYALADDAGGRFAIDASSGLLTVAAALDAETALGHTVVVRATSADGSTWTQAFAVAVTDVDEFDLVAIGDADTAPDTVAENAVPGTSTGLRARAVDADATTNAVTYALLDDAGGRFAIDASSGLLTVAAALDAETALGHTVVVRATSADGSTWTQALAVTVTDVDEFDLSALGDTDAAPDTVAEDAAVGTPVGLQAHAVDADIGLNTVTYALLDSAGGRFAVDTATGVVTVAAALDAETALGHTVVVRATSADGSTVTRAFTVAITAVNDQAPVITSDGGGATATLTVPEGGDTTVTQVRATDADLPAETLRYTLAGGADAARFTLDAVTGVLRFARAPDAEQPLDQGADNTYDVRVQVSDGLRTDTQSLQITVQPLNDHAPVFISDGGGTSAVRHVDENTLAVTRVQARDADLPADTLAYALAGGADAALFTIDAATGALRWRLAPDHETPGDADADGVYDLVVRASDGLYSVSQSLAVVVDNVDEAPELLANTLAVDEGGMAVPVLRARDVDTDAARLVYRVQDLAGGRFETLAASGVAITQFTQAQVDAGDIRFVADGGEAAPAYRLVLADDRSTLAAQPGAVAFTPVNDTPVVNPVDLGTLDEDTPRVFTAAELLASATDAEGDPLTVSDLQLVSGAGTLTDLGDGRWRFDPAADWHGAVALAGTVDDGQASTALRASLQVLAVNDAPRFVSGGGAATVALDQPENTAVVGTLVGADVDTDPGKVTPLRYAVVGGADAARFVVDAATGVLSFRQAPDREQPADADADHRYDVTVQVSDGVLTAQQALQITVTNVDEAPVVTRNVLLLTDGAVTLVLQARDPDTPASALTYRVDTVEGGQFERAAQPGQAVQVFTQAELDAAQVAWVAPAGSTSARYALRLSDGVSEVLVGSPGVENQTVPRTALEMAPAASLSGERPSAPSDGAESGVVAAAAASGRRAEPLPPAPAGNAGDASLGLGQGAETTAGAGRSAGTKAAEVGAAVSRSAAARAGLAPVAERIDAALDLPSDSAEAPKRLVTELDLWGSRSGDSLAEQLDRLRQEVADAQQAGMVSLASTALVSTGLSVGYVVWLVRGGVLMTSLMSVVPAWAGLDPLPVLSEIRRAEGGGVAADGTDEDEAGGGDDDPIEKLFSKARRLLVRPAAGSADAPGLPETPA